MTQKTITLPSGKTAVISDFKGKHIRKAQQIGAGDSGKMMFALIAEIVTIDGNGIVMEDLDEMSGPDVLKLMTELDVNF
jgi:hypothetical protein